MNSGNTSKSCLICFVGIDGSGKTTLAKALTKSVEEYGIDCRYVWGGFTSSFTVFKPLIGGLKATVFSGDTHMEESTTKGRVLKNPRLSALYHCLALTDYIIQAAFRIRLPLAFGRNVICDRYIYDLVTGIGVIQDYPVDKTLALLRRCLAFVPKPDLAFLVDVPEPLAYERKADIISLGFLSVRRNMYLQMARQEGMTILDGTQDRAELKQLVTTTVLPQLMGET